MMKGRPKFRAAFCRKISKNQKQPDILPAVFSFLARRAAEFVCVPVPAWRIP
jgi:hypothetical protein